MRWYATLLALLLLLPAVHAAIVTLVPNTTAGVTSTGTMTEAGVYTGLGDALTTASCDANLSDSGTRSCAATVGSATKDDFFITNFTLPTNGGINRIDIKTITRTTAASDKCEITIYNWTSSAWKNVNGTAAACPSASNTTLTYNITSQAIINDLVSANALRIMSDLNGGSSDSLVGDYIEVNVSYNNTMIVSIPNVSTNGSMYNHSLLVSSSGTLAGYKFEWNATGVNCDQGFQNVSTGVLSGASSTVQVNLTPAATCAGKTIGWRIYANNTEGGMNTTDVQLYQVGGCGVILMKSKTLTGNLTYNGTCFTAGASNIVIDGNGMIIRGFETGAGVNVSGYNNITIKNFYNVSNFSYGVLLTDSNTSNITKNSLSMANVTPFTGGLVLSNSHNTTISENTVITYGDGGSTIEIISSNGTLVERNNISSFNINAKPIDSTISSGLGRFNENIIYARSDTAVYIRSAEDNITNNTITSSENDGIQTGYRSFVSGNTIISSIIPINVEALNATIVYNNISLTSDSTYGIFLNFGNATVSNNNINITTTGTSAIYASSISHIISNNTIYTNGSGSYGVNIIGNNITVANNSITTTKEDSIIVSSTSSGIVLQNNTINNTNTSVFQLRLSPGANGTALIDQNVARYNFTNNLMSYRKTGLVDVNFTAPLTQNGTNLSADIQLAYNNVTLNSSKTGLNKSANITFYTIPTGGFSYAMLRDGAPCAAAICKNSTALSAGTVKINVTGWSSYSIQSSNCTTITTNITLVENITASGTCLTVGANNVIIDGSGYSITGSTTGNGIDITNRNNTIIRNFGNITNFNTGIYISNSNNSRVTNNTVSSASVLFANGIYLLTGSKNTSLVNNTIMTNGSNSVGIYVNGPYNTNITNNNIVTTNVTTYGIYFPAGNSSASNNTITVFDGFGILISSSNNTAINNNITTTNTSTPGVYVNGDNNTVAYNNITTIGSSANGVRLVIGNNTIIYNNITTQGSGGAGVYFNVGINSTASNNNITTLGSSANGVSIDTANNTVGNNNITTSGIGSRGVYLNAGNNTITGNRITATGASSQGILFGTAGNSTATGNIINATSAAGIELSGTNITASNNTIAASSTYDILLSGANNTAANNILTVTTGAISVTAENNTIQNNTISGIADQYDLSINAGIHGTTLIDQSVRNYTFAGLGSRVNFRKTGVGDINFSQAINGSGYNLSADVWISQNNATVNSTQTGLNKTANITLYGITPNILNNMRRDGSNCPASICTNLTPLNQATVTFNVTQWSTYSIKAAVSCGFISTNITLIEDLTATDTCFTINGNNIIIDGAGYNITSNGSGYGILLNSRNNTLIKNFGGITNFTNGIIINNSNYTNVTGNTIITNSIDGNGINITGAYNTLSYNVIATFLQRSSPIHIKMGNNTITNNNLTNTANGGAGIFIESGTNTTIQYNKINTTGNSEGIYFNTGYNIATYNNITTSTYYAIYFVAGNNTANYNILNGSTGGIRFGANNNTASYNNITTVTIPGAYLGSGSNNTLANNYITTTGTALNGAYGISIDSNNNLIVNNTINTTKASSILLYSIAASNNVLQNNTILTTNTSVYHLNFSFPGINGTTFVDQQIENYTIPGAGGLMNFRKTGIAEINFTTPISGTGINLSADIWMSSNNATVNSSKAGLNRSANITLYGITPSATNAIYRDGVACPGSICTNLTSLNAATVTFNVTAWSSYAISDPGVNNPPSWNANLADTPDPITAGDGVTYTGTGTDAEGNQYRMTVCRTNSITNGYPGTCAASQTLCTSSATNSASQASCSYTSSSSDIGTLTAYAFLCDAGGSTCTSSTSTSTTVNAPVNNAPSWSVNLADAPDPVVSGNAITYTGKGTDAESDQYKMTVCRTNSITDGYPGTCDSSQTLCTSSATNSASQASCSYTSAVSDEGTLTAYAFLCDAGSSTCSASTNTATTVNSCQDTYLAQARNITCSSGQCLFAGTSCAYSVAWSATTIRCTKYGCS